MLETRFVRLLKQHRLPLPDRQVAFEEDGRFLGRVDFVFSAAKLVVEADGFRWHSTRRSWERDRARHTDLTAAGVRVIHITWGDVHERPAWLASRLRRALGIQTFDESPSVSEGSAPKNP